MVADGYLQYLIRIRSVAIPIHTPAPSPWVLVEYWQLLVEYWKPYINSQIITTTKNCSHWMLQSFFICWQLFPNYSRWISPIVCITECSENYTSYICRKQKAPHQCLNRRDNASCDKKQVFGPRRGSSVYNWDAAVGGQYQLTSFPCQTPLCLYWFATHRSWASL
jgi:hypothetical protein